MYAIAYILVWFGIFWLCTIMGIFLKKTQTYQNPIANTLITEMLTSIIGIVTRLNVVWLPMVSNDGYIQKMKEIE